MIVLYHKNNKVYEIWNSTSLQNIPSNESRISKQLMALAEKYPKYHEEFANRTLQMLENSALQKQFGIKAREKVTQKFSNEIGSQQGLLFYEVLNDLK